jgi:hypothetical protein
MLHITRSTPPHKHTRVNKKKTIGLAPKKKQLPIAQHPAPSPHTHTNSLTLSQTSKQIQTRFAACSSLTLLQTSQQGIHYNQKPITVCVIGFCYNSLRSAQHSHYHPTPTRHSCDLSGATTIQK